MCFKMLDLLRPMRHSTAVFRRSMAGLLASGRLALPSSSPPYQAGSWVGLRLQHRYIVSGLKIDQRTGVGCVGSVATN